MRKLYFIILLLPSISMAANAAPVAKQKVPSLVLETSQQRAPTGMPLKQPSTNAATNAASVNTTQAPIANFPMTTNPPPANPSTPALSAPAAPTAAPITPQSKHNPVFKRVIRKQFPLSNEQIIALHRKYKGVQRAVSSPPFAPPKPLVSSKVVNLAPGVIPPVIRLATGYVSSIVFVDETGSPWPIQAYDLGDPAAFNVQWDSTSHIMMIQGVKSYATGNMAVLLAGKHTPVMLTIVNDQRVVDYRLELRVEGMGPNAQKSMISANKFPRDNDRLLLDLLQGVVPPGSQPLSIEGNLAKAWLFNGKMLLRTRLNVLSPPWQSTMKSDDGTKVYVMSKSPMVLASDAGEVVSLKVEGL